MQKHAPARTDIYPGIFVPSIDTKWIDAGFLTDESTLNNPVVHVKDYNNEICVELMMPGVKREDLLIEGKNNRLNVTVFQDIDKSSGNNNHDTPTDCMRFHREITLPEKADLSFVCATFDDGVLKLQIPKSDDILENYDSTIAVY